MTATLLAPLKLTINRSVMSSLYVMPVAVQRYDTPKMLHRKA